MALSFQRPKFNNWKKAQLCRCTQKARGQSGICPQPKGVFGTAPQTLLHKLHRGAAPQKTGVCGVPL